MSTKDKLSDLIAITLGNLFYYGLPAFIVGIALIMVAKVVF